MPDAPPSPRPAGPPETDDAILQSAEAADDGRELSPALRSRARHLAALALYSQEAHRFGDGQPLREFLRWLSRDPPRRARARAVAEAVLAERARLDALLGSAATGWALDRMGATERALLRVAAGELLVLRDAPAGAVINDCVELARRYGDEPSPGFVNAVLSQFAALPEAAAILAARPADERGVDLHVHTDRSDGDLAPEELVAQAAGMGLAAVAVADHDEVAGVAPAAAAGARLGVEVVSAVELTSYRGDDELHLLGLFIDPEQAALREKLAFFREARVERARKMCHKLKELGAPVELERVLAVAGPGAVGRPHVARALVEAGHCRSPDEAFRRYLKNGGPAWVSKAPFAPEEAIALVHAAGGLAFLAHPGISGRDGLIPDLIRGGLDGLEARHGLHAAPVAEHYLRWTRRRDLLVSGGSDFHGAFKSDSALGRPFVPETWLIEIRNHWKLFRAGAARSQAAGEPGTPNPEPR